MSLGIGGQQNVRPYLQNQHMIFHTYCRKWVFGLLGQHNLRCFQEPRFSARASPNLQNQRTVFDTYCWNLFGFVGFGYCIVWCKWHNLQNLHLILHTSCWNLFGLDIQDQGGGGGCNHPPLSENCDFSGTELLADLRPVCNSCLSIEVQQKKNRAL